MGLPLPSFVPINPIFPTDSEGALSTRRGEVIMLSLPPAGKSKLLYEALQNAVLAISPTSLISTPHSPHSWTTNLLIVPDKSMAPLTLVHLLSFVSSPLGMASLYTCPSFFPFPHLPHAGIISSWKPLLISLGEAS